MRIKTFVFLDCETTGLPCGGFRTTKITELCLISAQAEHIGLGVLPRVQNKLNLCFNPLKRIQPGAEQITGLYNDELDQQTSFNDVSLNLLKAFLERLSKPVCFVAHNGDRFDYPILRNHIDSVGNHLPNDILCIDSLIAFRSLLNKTYENEEIAEKKETSAAGMDEWDDWDEVLCDELSKIEETICLTPPKINDPQVINETTPDKGIKCITPGAPKRGTSLQEQAGPSRAVKSHVQRKLNFVDDKFTSFKLGDIYEKLLRKPVLKAHEAEIDVKMLLECAVHLGEHFVDWANINAVFFDQIPKMNGTRN